MATTDPHYTMRIEVHKVTPAEHVFKDSYDKAGREVPRTVDSVTSIVIRAASLELLVDKAQKLVPLVAE